jgi:hypothetical protein
MVNQLLEEGISSSLGTAAQIDTQFHDIIEGVALQGHQSYGYTTDCAGY